MPGRIEFWFEFASTYSWLAAERIEPLAAAAGVGIDWRPFLLGPIFAAQGWNNSPFNIYPAKGRYMWRDMERLSADYDLKLRRPSTFPRNGLLAARIALAHEEAPWLGDFVRAVYRANFAEDREISDPGVIASILKDLDVDAAAATEAASSDSNKARLKAQTERAQQLGLFGAPSFTVGEELFWGNDRLEQALAFAREA
ncbi:MAG: 2-hydroxychromene-2-carboxylate isomerase [Reyranellaceae bacterium]